MGLWDKIRGEFIDIIQWLDDTNDTLVYRFERYGNEIKYGAKLVVRESQVAVFINEGQLADVFKPGTYTLSTQNMPILSTLQGWKYGLESPFKAEVYFVSTRQFTSLKWGTPGPCTMRDAEFGLVRVSAFGIFAMRMKDPVVFIKEVAGTDGRFSTEEISANLRGKLGLRIKETFPQLGVPVVDLETNVGRLGDMLREKVAPMYEGLGLELTEVQVQDISLPEEVEKAIDKAGAIKAVGNLGAYTQYEMASSIRDAAQNPGGVASAGVGMGMGFGMAQQMAQSWPGTGQAGPAQTPTAGGPPPLPQQIAFYAVIGGQQAGPYDQAAFSQLVAQGQITRETLVWRQGMANWTPAGQVAETAPLFAQMPPPVPPPPPAK